MKNTFISPREQLVNNIIEILEKDPGVWVKTWRSISTNGRPYNPVSGTTYSSFNLFYLSLQQHILGTIDNRWCTFNQAKLAGIKVRKGQKALGSVLFYESGLVLLDKKEKVYDISKFKSKNDIVKGLKQFFYNESGILNLISGLTTSDKVASVDTIDFCKALITKINSNYDKNYKVEVTLTAKTFPVFNFSQMENVPELKLAKECRWPPITRAESILNASSVKIYHDQADRNFYSPTFHEIHLTPKQSFATPEAYYATALHELAHASIGEGVKRNFEYMNTDEDYAREELRAEIASAFICAEIGAESDINNHQSYLHYYLQFFKENYKELFFAISDANAIAEHCLAYEKAQNIELVSKEEGHSNLGKQPGLFPNLFDVEIQIPVDDVAEAKHLYKVWQANRLNEKKFNTYLDSLKKVLGAGFVGIGETSLIESIIREFNTNKETSQKETEKQNNLNLLIDIEKETYSLN